MSFPLYVLLAGYCIYFCVGCRADTAAVAALVQDLPTVDALGTRWTANTAAEITETVFPAVLAEAYMVRRRNRYKPSRSW